MRLLFFFKMVVNKLARTIFKSYNREGRLQGGVNPELLKGGILYDNINKKERATGDRAQSMRY